MRGKEYRMNNKAKKSGDLGVWEDKKTWKRGRKIREEKEEEKG